jgi:hypothetical protein
MKKTMRQIIRVKGHERIKCSIVSVESQKQHFVHPCQFCLARLSFVNNTLLFRNHIKISTLSGILSFYKYVRKNLVCPFIRSKYIDFTVKTCDHVSFQTNLSGYRTTEASLIVGINATNHSIYCRTTLS